MVNVNCCHNASLFILIICHSAPVCAPGGVLMSLLPATLYHLYHGALVTPDSGHLLSDVALIDHGIVLAPL